jgi:hypothetical protein
MTTPMLGTRRSSNYLFPFVEFRVGKEREGSVDRAEHGDHTIQADDDLLSLLPSAKERRDRSGVQSFQSHDLDDECQMSECARDVLCVRLVRREIIRLRHSAHIMARSIAVEDLIPIRLHDGGYGR